MKTPAPSIVVPYRVDVLSRARQQRIIHEAADYRKRGTSLTDKIRFVREHLRQAAEVLIPAAESMKHADGALKKEIVEQEMMRLLRAAEGRLNIFPAVVEPAVFWILRRGVSSMIESVFDRLEEKGYVNVEAY